jgi:ketosteroid isomerase-like protein
MPTDRKQLVRDAYAAFAAGDRDFYERHLSDDLLFSAPPDPKLDRDGYFERCWPGAGRGQSFELVRLIESGPEVVATYETSTSGGTRGRNTEVFTFGDDDRIKRIEVYFGWELGLSSPPSPDSSAG